MATVLVAEDSRVQLQLLGSWLRDAGHTVVAAVDCFQAWSAAVSTPPDLMLLDLNMPAGNGVDVLKKLKSSWKTSQIPVLVISANPDSFGPLVKSLGALGYIQKPLDFDQFSAELAKALPSPTM